MTYTINSLFCGAGGLDVGFHQAGFKTIWANDINKDACQTFKNYFPDATVIKGSVTKIDSRDVPDADVFLGGFPCQGFSQAGARKTDDPRNQLYKDYVRLVTEKQPLMFIGENVQGLLSMKNENGKVIDQILSDFSHAGYNLDYKVLNAYDYEVPQTRKRLIIVGRRKDITVPFIFPDPIPWHVNQKDALKDIPFNPDELDTGGFSSRYITKKRKREWDEPSYTIPASARHVPLHPDSQYTKTDERYFYTNERRFTYREAAAIQTFPPNYPFTGVLSRRYTLVGNSVPPRLAYHVALSVKATLDQLD